MIVLAVEAKRLIRFHLTGDRLEVELTLEPSGDGPNAAPSFASRAPGSSGCRRALPREALFRLHALCQTGAA